MSGNRGSAFSDVAAHPRKITAESGPWPLHDAAAGRAFEAAALALCEPHALMERAGLATAKLARALAPAVRLVEVWCGPGNNGGDGLVAARWLHGAGTPVRVFQIGADATRMPADAAHARQRAIEAGLAVAAPPAAGVAAIPGDPPDLVIDALLGLGASRPPDGALAEAVGYINARGAPVLAVDMPSGLHPGTGQPLGPAVVKATHTLALLTLKPGLFTALGRDLAGVVWFDDLGHGSIRGGPGATSGPSGTPGGATAILAGPARREPWPHAAHKGRRGDAWIVGGAPGMAGAAWLAARAALAAGAGRVYVSALAGDVAAFDPARPELMCRPYAAAQDLLAGEATVVAGCGGGEAVRECLAPLLAKAPRIVLDADALNHLARAHELRRLLCARAGQGRPSVLTPHPLEAARLLGVTAAVVQADRLAAARALAERLAVVVVLKGSGTIVAAPGALPHLNPTGNAMLATAGTGDVLAGWLGGLWAQQPQADPLQVACAAVWQHGHAADAAMADAGRRGAPLLAADLIAALHASV
ncbi:MAG: NAD(P)H-hydrate dehydratase [Rubrivivax sp.]|nr:NAD(P)H-hydrate dehydratase [Rubrivivax sp.]